MPALRVSELLEEKKKREKRWIDLYQAARETGINYSNLFYIAKGRANPTLKTLLTLADYFDCSLNDLVITAPADNTAVAIRHDDN